MANFIGQTVECLQHALKWKTNKGKMDMKPFPVNRNYAKETLLREGSQICAECGYKCKDR